MFRRFLTALLAACALLIGTFGTTSAAPGWTSPASLPLVTRGSLSYAASLDSLGTLHAATSAPFYGAGIFHETTAGYETACCGNGNRFDFELAVATRVVTGQTMVRIVWTDPDRRDALWLTRNDTGFWVTSRLWIGKALTPTVANLGSGLAVAFRDGHDRLRYISWDPTNGPTQPQVVDPRCCRGTPSIAVHNGRPYIAWSMPSTSSGRLELAHSTGSGGWTFSGTIDSATKAPSLALTAVGTPVIAYQVSGDGVWYARRTSTGWTHRKVLPTGYVSPSIAVSSHGAIAVVADKNGAKVAFRRLDLTSNAVVLAKLTSGERAISGPYLAFHGSKATVSYQFSCACGLDGVYVTHQ